MDSGIIEIKQEYPVANNNKIQKHTGTYGHLRDKLETISGEKCIFSRATVVVQRPLSVRPLTQVSQKPLHGSRPNFVESYISAISPDLFIFFKIFDFQIFIFFYHFR